MKKASEYRQHARECRALASQMDAPERREQVLQMAEHWERLAADRLALIERHPDLVREGQETDGAAPPETDRPWTASSDH